MKGSPRSLLSSVATNIQWVGAGIVAQAALRIGVLAIMARLVGPRDFGIVSIAFVFTSFAERLGQVGVGPAFVQRARIEAEDVKAALVLSVASGCIITAALCAVAPLAASFFGEETLRGVLVVLAMGFIIDSFGVVSDGMLQRELRFREIVKVETAAFMGGLVIVGISLGYLGYGVWALVGANLAMRSIKMALLVCARPVPLQGRWSGARARELLATGFGFSLGKILNFLSLQGDNFIVGRVLGVEALGMYTRAYQAMTLPAMYVGQAFERVLFPALSKKQEDHAALGAGLLSTLEVSALVALPASVGMYFLSQEIVLVLFGKTWTPVIPVLQVLSCGVFSRAAYKCSDVLIRSKGDVYAYAARQAWYTAIIVGGSALGAYMNGLQGVAYAVVLGVSVNYALMTLLAARLARVSLSAIAWAHLPGVWASMSVALLLAFAVPIMRAYMYAPFAILLLSTVMGVAVAGSAWLLSWALVGDSYTVKMARRFLEVRRREEAARRDTAARQESSILARAS
jgi:O-antigen/teichoic acid export membrane protein